MMLQCWTCLLYGYLLLSVVRIDIGVCDNSCDPGWEQNGDYCYFFSAESETRWVYDADHECFIHDAQLAIPESKEELEYLQGLAKSEDTYGWFLNVFKEMSYYGFMGYSYFDMSTDSTVNFVPADGSLPQPAPTYDPAVNYDGMCIAFHLNDNWWDDSVWFEPVACSVKLNVVCRAEKSDLPDQDVDDVSWFSVNSAILWFGDQMAQFEDAKKMCESKGMALLDNIDGHSEDVSAATNPKNAVPFWSAATFGSSGLQWKTGRAINESEINWGEESTGTTVVVLLNSGYYYPFFPYGRWFGKSGFSFICKKKVSIGYLACPQRWKRAGRSCYSNAYGKTLTWNEGEKVCEKQGAHLLSIDSPDELLWMNLVFSKDIFKYLRDYVWTSANDLDLEGNFTWGDGSLMDTGLISFDSAGSSDLAVSRCAVLDLMFESIRGVDCSTSNNFPACQYSLEDGETGCLGDFREFNRTCYYLDEGYNYMSRDLNLPYCKSKVDGAISSYRVKELQAKAQEIRDFLATEYWYGDYWLGLEAKYNIGEYIWNDGTKQDVEQGYSWYSSTVEGEGHCVAVDSSFRAVVLDCEYNAGYVCEKEISDQDLYNAYYSGDATHLEMSLVFMCITLSLHAYSVLC